jgi:pyruvate-ferredoxin/flavodoxin oxidoreductase
VAHGLKKGMGYAQDEMKRAVEVGYWSLYRFNPQLKDAGKNPFILESKEPTGNFKEFLMGETRYASLMHKHPEVAEALFAKTEQDAKERFAAYKRLASYSE